MYESRKIGSLMESHGYFKTEKVKFVKQNSFVMHNDECRKFQDGCYGYPKTEKERVL